MHLKRIVLVLATAGTVLLAGCTAEGASLYSYDSNKNMAQGGSNLADVHDTFDVPGGKAQISLSIGGTGSAQVTIKDAAGQQVYTKSISGSGGAADSTTMTGAAGQWSIDIDFTNYQGGFALSITEV